MRVTLARSLGWTLCIVVLHFATAGAINAENTKPIAAAGVNHIAIKGYDTVAYFTEGKATKGSSSFEYMWNDARWRFASVAHRDMFIADPDHYAPQFGGFCAGAIIDHVLVPANPESWVIVDGKLYMVAGSHDDLAAWQADAAEHVKQGGKQWALVQPRPAGTQE